MADVKTWLREATEAFGGRLEQVTDDQWTSPTPNADWDVRALVAHVVDEHLWAPPLLAGRTMEDIGDEVPADPLGDGDPAATYRTSSTAMITAVDDVDLDRPVHLSFGEVPAHEYLMQLFADHLIHAWDLARATGQDETLDPELVRSCGSWFADREAMYRDGGVIGPAVAAEAGGPQAELLGRFGRRA